MKKRVNAMTDVREHEAYVPAPNLRPVLVALLLGMLLSILDGLIVNTAMPTITAQLGGVGQLAWVVTGYTLATAASTPVWGKLGDMYGRKRTYLWSIGIFLAGSALAGTAQSMTALIGFRVVQGLGGGGLMTGAFAIFGDLIPLRERGRYSGMMASTSGVAMVVGPLVGGLITDHLGWRWIFYINLIPGVIAFAMIAALLKLPHRSSTARVDYPGAVLLTAAVVGVALISTWGGGTYGWFSPVILTLALLTVVSALAFGFVERRAAAPMLPLDIFRNVNFSLITLVSFVLGVVMYGAMTFLPIFQQAVQGASATNSGLLLLPVVLAMTLVSLFGRRITRSGRLRRFVVLGSVLITAGLLLLSRMDAGTSRVTTGAFMAVYGIGAGLLMQTTMLIAQNSAERRNLGVATSTATLSRTIGGSIGISLMGVLFNHQIASTLSHGTGAAAAGGHGGVRLDASALARMPEALRSLYQHAVAAGAQHVFLFGAAATAIGIVAAYFVKDVPLGAGPAAEPRPGPADQSTTSGPLVPDGA
jgi:EmrB/QacA subfamily drug resistance transporter